MFNINKSLFNLSEKEWNIEHYDGCPAFTEITGLGFTYSSYGKNYPSYNINICYYKDGEGDWMSLISEHKFIGQTIINSYLNNQEEFKSYYQNWLKEFNAMLNFYYENFSLDLSRLDNKEFKKWMKSVYNFYRNKVNMPGFIDGFMFYADKRFDSLVKDFCEDKKIKNYPIIYSVLSAAIEPSFINEEEDDLNKIIREIKKIVGDSKKLIFTIKKNKVAMNLIAKHYKKYSWIKSSYADFNEYKMKDVLKEIEENFDDKKSNFNIFSKHKKDKKKLVKKYKFTPEIIAIIELTERLIKWQDQRKVYTLTFVSLQSKILREVSQRTKVDYDLLKYSTINDLYLILDKKFKIKELLKRRKSSLFIYQNKKIKVFLGEKAKNFLKKVNKVEFDNNIREINGMVASVGKAKGIVKIIMSVKQIQKVEEGDILVAPMTRPEHLIGMKKAIAIITDDGGITCHAAIISRELNIPCIIGTKIVTKVLKDGDLVEVDANNGVVRILKKK